MIHVHVALPSGHSEKLSVMKSSKVEDLRTLAEKSLGRRFLTLVTAGGRVLNPIESLESAGLQDEDQLSALSQKVGLMATSGAFALWCPGDERILTWGDQELGGDSSEVRDQLIGVQQLQATRGAFAAQLADGSVVTWGDPDDGGDSSHVQAQLVRVQSVMATDHAFAALLADGSVVTWGDPVSGGDSSRIR